MERDRPQLVVVSVSVRCDSALREFAQRWQIPVLASSGVFDYGGVRGILRCDSLLLEPLPLMRCYSGSFIRAEVRRGRAERTAGKDAQRTAGREKTDHALGNHFVSGFLFFWKNRPFPGKKESRKGGFLYRGIAKRE